MVTADNFQNQSQHRRSVKNSYRMLSIKAIKLILDIMLFFVAFIWFRYESLTNINFVGFRYNLFATIIYCYLIYSFNKTYNANLFGFVRIRMIFFSQFLSQFFSVTLLYLMVSVAWQHFRSPLPFVCLLIAQGIIDLVYAYCGSKIFFHIYPTKKTLLIYRNGLDKKRFGAVSGKPLERLHKVTDELNYDGSFHELKDKLEGYDSIFVAGVNSRCRNGIIKYCVEKGIACYILPHVGDTILKGAKHIQSFDSPVLYVNRKVIDPLYAIVKRAFDIIASGLALILFGPLMLVIALIIRLYDKGPAFYKQTRLTINGKQFKIIKFRSMRVDAEKDGVARLSSGDKDDRITPIGRFIRKCRIDELPQLINIFKGDMSIVGPRPERPEIAEQYYETMPDFKLRLQVKAGLTGYAQVYGKYNSDPYEKLEFDILYIDNMNVITDLELCFATFSILFQSESTEGIEVGQTTALQDDSVTQTTNSTDSSMLY